MESSQQSFIPYWQNTPAYRVAIVWNEIVNAAAGEYLKEKERELWKMGGDVAGVDAVVPRMQVSWTDNEQNCVGEWMVIGNDIWFPKSTEGYRKLWMIISCATSSFEELEALYEKDPASLKKMCEDIAKIYSEMIKNAAKQNSDDLVVIPSGMLKSFKTKSWLNNLAGKLNMKTYLSLYKEGYSAEDILRGR